MTGVSTEFPFYWKPLETTAHINDFHTKHKLAVKRVFMPFSFQLYSQLYAVNKLKINTACCTRLAFLFHGFIIHRKKQTNPSSSGNRCTSRQEYPRLTAGVGWAEVRNQ